MLIPIGATHQQALSKIGVIYLDKKEYLEDKLKNCKLGKKFSGNLRSESLFNEEIETIEGIMEDLKNYENKLIYFIIFNLSI